MSSGKSINRFSASESNRNWLHLVNELGILVSRLESSMSVCNLLRRPIDSGRLSNRLSLIANSSRLLKLDV